MQWFGSEGQQLHIELTSSCQASCPACSRVYDYSSQIEERKVHSSWSLEKLQETFSSEVLKNVSEVLLCGNYGDPLGFDQLDQFIKYILSQNSNIKFVIHTNGGLGSTNLWQSLGSLLAAKGHQVKVSIDGLKDTNHIYRRGVSWSKLMENMKIFIESGGRPYWKFISFNHNTHQEQEARELAKTLGFYHFEVRSPYGDPSGYIEAPKSTELSAKLQTSFMNHSIEELKDQAFSRLVPNSISCKVLENPSLYFDHDQRVWPCCWLAQDGDHRTRTKNRELFYRKVYDQGVAKDFNDLTKHTLLEILTHPFFQDILPKSWEDDSIKNQECFSTCLKTCSKKS